ncbi:winged helix-turn-helix transcriptional regulator [Pedobacter sp. R-06]|uniref:winged helix-turn-helix transcriptional regulator n=1 Tax=Pedobacter sp. R-06 TaxID=3404051 RepID=UPI003CEF65F1
METEKTIQIATEVLSNPRNQKEEVQALQDTLYVLGGKWKLPIINSICNGNKRFRDIERSIPGITTRMLSKELKEMTANQLIKRTVIDDTPVSIEYTSTEYCQSFGGIILEMIRWGKSHRQRLKGTAD